MDGACLPTAIRLHGQVVGSLSARINTFAQSAEVGYWIHDAATGRGVATRATTALVEHLTTDLGIRRVEIRASVQNTRSRAVAGRLGFEYEGTLRARPVTDPPFVPAVTPPTRD